MKKRMLSTLLVLCVALALVPAAGAAGVEDYQYFKFSNEPIGCYQVTISGQVLPAVWVFPDGTEYTVTMPDGGGVHYKARTFWDEYGFITVDDAGPYWYPEPITDSLRDNVEIWQVIYDMETGEVVEEIYICQQSSLDDWVAAGVATVTDATDQPTTPAQPEQPTTPATPADTKAVLSPQGLKVDGKDIDCEKYNISDRNYFKLRDLAQLLSGTGSQFQVGYDEATATVSITTGQAYTPNGTELLAGVDNSATAQPSNQAILINGEKNEELTVYNIGGSNFFQLRELGNILGFEVDYDQATNTAIVNSIEK